MNFCFSYLVLLVFLWCLGLNPSSCTLGKHSLTELYSTSNIIFHQNLPIQSLNIFLLKMKMSFFIFCFLLSEDIILVLSTHCNTPNYITFSKVKSLPKNCSILIMNIQKCTLKFTWNHQILKTSFFFPLQVLEFLASL